MTVTRSAPAGRRRTGLRPAQRCRAGTAGTPGTAAAPATTAAPESRRGRRAARIAAAAVALAALAAAGVTERAAVAASFAVLGHLHWLWIPAALVLESASMAAFAIMLRRLLATGAPSVGLRPMLATAYAANALSVSVPLAGPELATAFTYRRFTRQGADAPLADWSLLVGGVVSTAAGVLVVGGGGLASGNILATAAAVPGACSPWPPSSGWPPPRAGRGCATRSDGPPPGRCVTGPGWCAGPPTIPARPSGPGLTGWARSSFRRRAG